MNIPTPQPNYGNQSKALLMQEIRRISSELAAERAVSDKLLETLHLYVDTECGSFADTAIAEVEAMRKENGE